MNIPSKEECLAILDNNKTPSNVIKHCKTVCQIAEELVDKLIEKGIEINKDLVIASALLHDIERDKKNHVEAGASLIKSMGFPEVSEIIRKHTLYNLNNLKEELKTIEEKIVFYADKRVKGSKIVDLKERFDDLVIRYNNDFTNELNFTKKIEEEINLMLK